MQLRVGSGEGIDDKGHKWTFWAIWWKYSIIWLWWRWWLYNHTFPKLTDSTFQEGEHYYIRNYISMNFYTRYLQLDPWQRWVWKDGLVFQFLTLMAVTRCSYSKPSIRPVERYRVIVTGTLFTRTHPICSLHFLRSTMYPVTWEPPSSSGGYQVSVMPSRETSNICVSGGPGMSAAGNREVNTPWHHE